MIFLNILMIFSIKEKFIILTHTVYCWLIATNIPVLLMTGIVVQGREWVSEWVCVWVSEWVCVCVCVCVCMFIYNIKINS